MSHLAHFQQFVGKKFPEGMSGFTAWLDGTLLNLDEQSMQMSFEVRKDMLNPIGFLHGGVHAAILDELSGFLVATLPLDSWYVSVNLTVDYFGKVGLGEKIVAQSILKRVGKTIIHVESELKNEKGELVSRSTSNLANTHKPKNVI